MEGVERLRRRARSRLMQFRSLLSDALQESPRRAHEAAAYITMEGLNLWAEFAREYFRCALRNEMTRTGRILTTRFPKGTSIDNALRQIPTVLRRNPACQLRRMDEPAWHSRRAFLKVVRLAGLSSVQQVVASLAIPAKFTEHLYVARNFFAHRNEETANKVRRLGPRYAILKVQHPCDLILGTEPGRPVVVLEDWLAEIEAVIDHMSV